MYATKTQTIKTIKAIKGEILIIYNVHFRAYQDERSNTLVSGLLLESLRVAFKLLSANWKSFFHSSVNSLSDLNIELISQYKQFVTIVLVETVGS